LFLYVFICFYCCLNCWRPITGAWNAPVPDFTARSWQCALLWQKNFNAVVCRSQWAL
jgi:hypothetical protein